MPTQTLPQYHNLTLTEKLEALRAASMKVRYEGHKPFIQRALEPILGANINISEAIASIPLIPIQKEQFYYNDYPDIEKREQVFAKYLKKYGVEDAENFAGKLVRMGPEEAYKEVGQKASKIFASRLRDEVFTKPFSKLAGNLAEKQKDIMSSPVGRFTIGLQPPFLMQTMEDSIAKTIGKDNFQQLLQDSQHFVKIDYENMGLENAAWMGLVESLPIANKLIRWEGSGLNKFNESSSYYMMKGLGALTGTILQLMLMRKATRPFAQDALSLFSKDMGVKYMLRRGLTVKEIAEAWRGFPASSRVKSIVDSSRKISSILMGGLDYGMNYTALTGLQIGMNNYIENKHFDSRDLSAMLRSFELGSAIGGISAAWWGTQIPFIIQKPVEELEQSVVAAMSTMQSMYEETGTLSYEDFAQAFMWELIEVPFENALPLALGLFGTAPMSGSLARMGNLETEVLKARTETIRQNGMGMTESYARGLADGKITDDMEKFESDNKRPMTFIEKKRYFENVVEKARKKEDNNIYEMTKGVEKAGDIESPRNFYGKELEKNRHYRNLRWLYNKHYPNKLPTVENVRSLFEMPESTFYKEFKRMSWDDQEFNIRNAKTFLWNSMMYGEDFANTEKINVLKDKLKSIGRISPDALKGKVKRKSKRKAWKFEKGPKEGRVNVINEESGEIIGTVDPEPVIKEYIHRWQEEFGGYRFPLEQFHDTEIDMIMNDILIEQTMYSNAIELIKKNPEIDKDALVSTMVDNIKGRPFWHAKLGDKVFGKYMKLREAINITMRHEGDAIHKDIENIVNKRLGRRITHHEDFWKNLKWSIKKNLPIDETLALMAKDGMRIKDAEAFKEVRNEFKAWFTSDENSPYFKNNNWKIKEGLRYYMGIPPDIGLEDYDPIISFASTFDWDDDALPYMRNVHEIPRERISELQNMSYEDYKKSDVTGKLGLILYTNRGLKNKYLHGPLKEYENEIKKLNLDKGQMNRQARFIRDIRGIPKTSDVDIENTLLNVANKIPAPLKRLLPGVGENGELTNRNIELGLNAALSFIYAGGLGFRLSSAVKNSLQGPLNTPPGMTMAWWMNGLMEILSNKEARDLCWNRGIFHAIGVPGLYEDFQNPLTKVLQQSLLLFTSVDHYWNRGPIYIGARNQFDYYFNKNRNDPNPILRTAEQIGSKQMENIGIRWKDLARQAEASDQLFKQYGNEAMAQRRDALVEKIKDEYGFIQQANSNWEYGTMGRPHIFATKGGKLAGTFMTWPTWYWGTYLPSLVHGDKFGLVRHLAKQTLAIYLFNKFLHMNIRPWVGFGTLPIAPYGPLPQMIFKAIEWKQANLYGHDEWTKNARGDFMKSLMVGVPGWYAVTDWMKVLDEYHKQTPYWDKRTGILHTGTNHWKAWSDLAGVTTFYNDQKRMIEYIKNGERDAAAKIGKIYNMQKVYRRPTGAVVE